MARVTSRDVAKLAGVSQSTVSMILGGKSDASFSHGTVERVMAAAKQLSYSPSLRRKTGGRNRRERSIAIFCPTLENPYYTMLTETISKLCKKYGYSLLICDTHRNLTIEESYVRLLSPVVSGAIFAYLPQDTTLIQKVSIQVPVVLLGDKDETIAADAVELNSIKAGILIARHLLGLGHKKIAYFSTPISGHMLARSRRLEGIRQEYERQGAADGVVVRVKNVLEEPDNVLFNAEYSVGFSLTKEMLRDGDEGVTAFVGLNDMVALGIMDALADAGRRIPQDYSVAGCDNNIFSGLRRVSLTTVEHFVVHKARDAFHMLLEKMESSRQGVSPRKIVCLEYEPKLIVRSSTGPNRRGAESRSR